MAKQGLSKEFLPQLVSVKLPVASEAIEAAERELSIKASSDTDRCYGYFPGMSRDGIGNNLPLSQKFAQNAAKLMVNGKSVDFNFLRLSLIDQPSISPFHLDSDSATALTGDIATMADRLVWRLLLNLSDSKTRTIIYLDLNPSLVQLKNDRGYISYPSELITNNLICSVELQARKGDVVNGVLFCASRVLHAGKDMGGGHFVAGYGVDE